MMARKRDAFTLVELLVVVAILTILVMLSVQALKNAIYAAQQVACLSNLKQLVTAAQMYSDDHERILPGYVWWNGFGNWTREESLAPYVGTTPKSHHTVYRCLGDAKYAVYGAKVTYGMLQGACKQQKISGTWQITEYRRWNKKGPKFMLFADLIPDHIPNPKPVSPYAGTGSPSTGFTWSINSDWYVMTAFRHGGGAGLETDQAWGADTFANCVFLDGHAQPVSQPDFNMYRNSNQP